MTVYRKIPTTTVLLEAPHKWKKKYQFFIIIHKRSALLKHI